MPKLTYPIATQNCHIRRNSHIFKYEVLLKSVIHTDLAKGVIHLLGYLQWSFPSLGKTEQEENGTGKKHVFSAVAFDLILKFDNRQYTYTIWSGPLSILSFSFCNHGGFTLKTPTAMFGVSMDSSLLLDWPSTVGFWIPASEGPEGTQGSFGGKFKFWRFCCKC